MMNTNSKRFKLQVLLESEIGCNNPSVLHAHFKPKFEQFVLDESLLLPFRDALRDDAVDTYYKACVSLVEALSAISKGSQSWAIVKLYYSAFYFLRVFFASRDMAMVRCGKLMYSLRMERGASVKLRSGIQHKGQQLRGDHQLVIYIYEKEFGENELILSNTISGINVFDWMMKAREDVNYKHSTFSEPDIDFFDSSVSGDGGLAKWLKLYIEDAEGLYLFQESHCCLAGPIYLLKKVRQELGSRLGVTNPFSERQYQSLMGLLGGTGLENCLPFVELINGD